MYVELLERWLAHSKCFLNVNHFNEIFAMSDDNLKILPDHKYYRHYSSGCSHAFTAVSSYCRIYLVLFHRVNSGICLGERIMLIIQMDQGAINGVT